MFRMKPSDFKIIKIPNYEIKWGVVCVGVGGSGGKKR